MKRVGFLAISEPSNHGTFQYTLSMLEALQLIEGLEITIYTSEGNHHYDNMGLKVRYVKASKKQWATLLVMSILTLRNPDPFKDEDYVLAPHYSPILLHTKKPFTFTLHDLQEYYFPKNFSVMEKMWRRIIINSLIAKKADAVICESEYVKKDIMRFLGVSAKKILVMTAPPVTLKSNNSSQANGQRIRDKYNLPSKYLFYPAQFWAHKNHGRLVEAFSKVAQKYPDVDLVLTGQKKYNYEKVFALVSRLGLDHRVNHLGFVERAELEEIYRGATALIMPSTFESVSIPIYEAFQYDVPVCCSAVVALPEQVGKAGILFDPLSIDSIAEAIESILKDPELRKQLAKEGQMRLMEMTPQRYSQELAELLNSKN